MEEFHAVLALKGLVFCHKSVIYYEPSRPFYIRALFEKHEIKGVNNLDLSKLTVMNTLK